MKTSVYTLGFFLLFVSIFHSSCSDDAIIRNQLTDGVWNIDQLEVREFTNNNLLGEQVFFNTGDYTFFDDGSGEYFEGVTGFFQDFVWNTDGFELVIVMNNQPTVYEVLQNGEALQVWRTFVDYGPDDFDEIVVRLSRF